MLREEGLRALVFRALGETVYRRLLVVERDLRTAAAPETPPALLCGFVDDAAEYDRLRPGRRAQAKARLAAGDRCWGTWLDGRLVAVRWLATGLPLVEYVDLPLPLRPDEIYHYDTFTDPTQRRRGLSAASQAALFPALRSEGFAWSIRAILPENRAAVADAARAGYRPTGRIGYVKLGRRRRPFRTGPR